MKRPMNKTSKCNACIAIATSAALCISPALAFAEDVDNVDGSSEAAASAPAENEVPPLEDEGSTSPESDSEQTDPDTQAITPAADSVTNEESQQRETINSYTWEFINVDTGERVLIGNFKIPFDSGVAKDTIAEYLPGSRYYGWDRRADSGGYLDWYIIYVVCPVNVPEGKQLAYNGTEQQGVESGSLYTLSGDYTATEIGTYTATATLKDGYKWTDGTTDPKQISWSIKQGTATKPTANTNLVYNGSEQMGLNEGEGYILSGDYKATNAGKYYATATLKDGYVWSDGSTDPVEYYTWTMTRAIATPPSAIPDLVYDGTEKTGLADDGVGYVLTEGSVVSATDAGTYTATVKPAENYKWITGAAGAPIKIEWSIAHASASKPTANTGLIYTGLPQKGVSGDGVGYTLSGEHKALLPGTYTATATLEENYKWADGTTDPVNITWSIDYATVAKPEAATGLTYNESEQMGIAEGMGYTLEGHKATEPGTYTATATLKSGYVWAGVEGDAAFEPITIEWSIDYATVAKPEAATNLVYTGESQTGVAEGTGYTLSGDVEATQPGTYTATATPNEGYAWEDGSTEPIEIEWSIAAVDPDEPVNPADPEDPANPKEKPEPPLVKKDAKESAVAKTGDEAPIAGLSLGALLAAAAAGLGLSRRKRDC